MKPDPDDAFQDVVGGSRHVEELYRSHSRAYDHHRQHAAVPWLSQLQSSFNGDDSRRYPMPPRLSDVSVATSWPIVRQRFPGDVRDAPPALDENYAAARSMSPASNDEYNQQRRAASPPVEEDSSPWRAAAEDERIHRRQSPPPPQLQPSTPVNASDPYR